MGGQNKQPAAIVSLRLEQNGAEIYSHSTLHVVARSPQVFGLRFPEMRVHWIDAGTIEAGDEVRAVPSSGQYIVEIDLVGAFAQRPILTGDKVPRYGVAPGLDRVEYGVRFYPFVSSMLRFCADATQGAQIGQFSLVSSSDVRVLLPRGRLVDQYDRPLETIVAHYEAGWRHSFIGHDGHSPSRVMMRVPICASGRIIAPTFVFPLLTWIATLGAVTVASFAANGQVVLATVAGAWAVLLKEWHDSVRAHQVCLQAGMFVVFGSLLALWGMTLELHTWASWPLGALLTAFVMLLLRVPLFFEYNARLPRWLTTPWSPVASSLERIRAKRRRNAGSTAFDHEDR